jgi:hypothetical protein
MRLVGDGTHHGQKAFWLLMPIMRDHKHCPDHAEVACS